MMSWTTVGPKASVCLARQAAPDLLRQQIVVQRHSLPRNLFHHSRRSRPFSSAQPLNLSTSSVLSASSDAKSKPSRYAAAVEPDARAAPSVRVTDNRSNQSSSTSNAETSSRSTPTENVLNVDAEVKAEKQAASSASSSSTSASSGQSPSQQQQQQQQQPEPSSDSQQQDQQAQQTPNTTQASTDPVSGEDLLKQRFFHAQEQNKRVYSGLTPPLNPAANLYPSFATPQSGQTIFPSDGSASSSSTASGSASPPPESSQQSTTSSGASADGATPPQTASTSNAGQRDIEFDQRLHRPASSQSLQSLQVPFDTHGFVKRLESGGWISNAAKAQRLAASSKPGKGKQAQNQSGSQELGLQIAQRHDPAEAIMEGVRHLITTRGRQLAHACLNKSDVENQTYLFKAALSEIRTEVQVRGRNDAAGLRSITTLLQREVDALEQKMKEDVERLKHDIQVDMNNRKAESKEEQNNLEQEIQDLNNRFTISLSDLKTEIEQNVKWDATRRSLFLVFGIAAIVAANLAIADYLTRDDEAAKAAASKETINAGHPPASANAAAPASLGWATEGRILSVLPIMLLRPNGRVAAASRRAFRQWHRQFSSHMPAVATAGLYTATKQPFNTRCRKIRAASPALAARATSSSASIRKESVAELRVPESDILIRPLSDGITIESQQLGLKPFHFDHVWLRDACQAPQSVHPSNCQKLFHTSDVPLGVDLLDRNHPPSLVTSGDEPALRLTFAKEHAVVNAFTATFGSVKPADAPHVSDLPISFLLRHAIPELYADTHMDIMAVPECWAAKDLSHFKTEPWTPEAPLPADVLLKGAVARPARIPWDAIKPETTSNDRTQALYSLTEAVVRDGFAFVTRLPTDTTSTEPGPESARLRDLASTMGELRNTFYGLLWDVQSKADARNIAYTNLDLGLHMDLLYFQNPPRFQFLHMLRNKVRGGASIFVDSFKVAERMWEQDRELWEGLTKVPVGFHYVNDGRHYRFTHPTFELAHETEGHAGPALEGTTMPRLSAVNYSPPFQSPLPLHPTKGLETKEKRELFYRALKRFSDLTLAEEFRYEKQMEEGECVIFDNRRVLHSRKGFEWDQSGKGEVKRWLKGCYVDGDAIWSTYRTLRTKVVGRQPLTRSRGLHAQVSARREFSTTTNNAATITAASPSSAVEALDPSSFAPLSDDPTVVDLRSVSGLRSRDPSTSFSSYRPVPPISTATIPKLYKQLSKSRLTFLVVLTGMAGYALCPASLTVAVTSPVTTLLALTAGMALCSAAANTLNQLVEAPYDAQMSRTRNRPLPSRVVTPLHAFGFASTCAVSGVGVLATMVNPLTAVLGAANVVLYSFTYTPLKRVSIANTWIGAIVGALPPLMGWAACTGTLSYFHDLGGWSLAALLFAWQFPHFNSLAHTLRAEYARGGYRMMAVTNPVLNRRVSLRYAVALLPICTVMMPLSGIVSPVAYAVLSTPLNGLMAHAAWKFYREGTVKSARWCFWVSLIHLPAVMLLAMGCKPEVWDGLYRFFGWSSTDEVEESEEKLV